VRWYGGGGGGLRQGKQPWVMCTSGQRAAGGEGGFPEELVARFRCHEEATRDHKGQARPTQHRKGEISVEGLCSASAVSGERLSEARGVANSG
jgi:hypothetical protein